MFVKHTKDCEKLYIANSITPYDKYLPFNCKNKQNFDRFWELMKNYR